LTNIGKYKLKDLVKENKGKEIFTGFADLQSLQTMQKPIPLSEWVGLKRSSTH